MDTAATNTLLIPDIPPSFFESANALDTIKATLEGFGHVHRFIAMKGFRRLMVIFTDTMDAWRAKQTVDRLIIRWVVRDDEVAIVSLSAANDPNDEGGETMEVRVYFGQHNPIDPDPATRHLQVPTQSRNFLISPPGSPFADWEQKSESPPNTAVLASGLMHALAELQDEPEDDFRLDDGDDDDDAVGDQTHNQPALLTIVCSAGSDRPQHLPLITVQDCGGRTNTVLSPTARPRPTPTALPPFPFKK